MKTAEHLSRCARLTRDRVTFALGLVCLATAQLAWAVPATVLWHLLPRERGERIGRKFISCLFRVTFFVTGRLGVLRVDTSALESIDPTEALIIAPNHPSVLDALILISRFDRLACIMKASVLDNVLLGAGARLAGYIRNDSTRRMMRLAADELGRGGQLIVFPEATRTVHAPVNEFKGGFAAIARRAGVPIQTVFIETDTPFLSKGWSVLKPPPRLPMTFRVRVGRRFEVDGDTATFVDALHRYYVRELASAEIGDLQPRSPESIRSEVDAFAHDEVERPSRWSPSHSSMGS